MTHRIAAALAAPALALALVAGPVAPAPAAAAPKKAAAGTATKKAAAKPAAAEPQPDELVERARALADAGRYDEALTMLQAARTRFPEDVGLQWMEAGVTGRSGRNRESVELYERMLEAHPGMARDVRLDLATQRLWAGDTKDAIRELEMRIQEQPGDEEAERLRALALAFDERHAESVAAYDALLARHPDDVELLLGRAQALAWWGRNPAAVDAYLDVLAKDPSNMRARMGVAWNENWSGRHRIAAEQFEAILASPDADPEAWKGLAWAEYWSGRHDQAAAPLAKYRAIRPDDPEGAELERMLAREFDEGLTVGYDWSHDTDDLRIFSQYAEYRIVTDPHGGLTLHWRRDDVKDESGTREPYRLGIGYQRILNDLWSARATVWSFKPGAGRIERGMGEFGLTFRPADRVTFEFAYVKEPVLTRLSLERDVDLRSGNASVSWNARPRVTLEASTAILHWSDENDGRRTSAGIRYALTSRRRFGAAVTAGYEVLTVDRDPGNGYYAPGRNTEWGPGVSLRWNPRETMTLGLNARFGWQEERGFDTEAFHNILASLATPIGNRLSWYIQYESSDSNLGSASGFEQNRWASYVNVPF